MYMYKTRRFFISKNKSCNSLPQPVLLGLGRRLQRRSSGKDCLKARVTFYFFHKRMVIKINQLIIFCRNFSKLIISRISLSLSKSKSEWIYADKLVHTRFSSSFIKACKHSKKYSLLSNLKEIIVRFQVEIK